jgi:hypothetical protein
VPRSPGRPLLAAATTTLLLLAAFQPVLGAVRTWTLTRSPASITAGTRTAVTLVVTDTGGAGATSQLGCLTVAIPAGFSVSSASVTAAPAGKSWSATVSGSGPATVTARAATDKSRLVGGAKRDSVTVRVVVTGRTRGTFAWTGTAYSERGCSKTLGGSQRLTISVAAAPTPRPTAAPTPRPTAKATPRPTASIRPATTASPAPATASPTPGSTPSPTPTVTPRPGRSPTARPTPDATATPVTPAGPLGGGPPPDEFTVGGSGPAAGEISVGLGNLGPFASFEWLVPSAVLAVPGLLLLIAVAAQVAGGIAWVPVSRRVLGGRRRGQALPTATAHRGPHRPPR